MPNSNIYEKGNVLPGGGGLNPILRQDLKLQNPMQPQPQNLMQPQLQTQSPLGLQPVAQQMTQQITPTLKQNYFASKPIMPQTTAQTQKTIPTAPLSQGYTPSPANPTQSVFDYLLAPSEEEKKLSKNNESKKRLLLLSDALRHLGNIYNTTRGATPQQFNSPVMEQEQLYQRKRNELRAQRAAAIKNAMDQAKLQADQDYKNSMLGMRAAELDRQRANDDWNKQFNLGKFAWQQDKDKNDFALKLAAQGETQRHNKVREGQMAVANRIAQQNANTSASKAANVDMKDLMPVNHFQKDKTAYLSKKWINSPQGYAAISELYNKLKNRYTRDSNRQMRPVVDKIYTNEIGLNDKPIEKTNPSAMEMLRALQKASFSADYMDFISQYGYDPNHVSYSRKPGIKNVAKSQAQKTNTQPAPKPQAKPKTTSKPSQQKSQSLGDKYSKYERN